jgi:hypothetical protein
METQEIVLGKLTHNKLLWLAGNVPMKELAGSPSGCYSRPDEMEIAVLTDDRLT